ncbi:MAG: hypothetical protein HY646_10595 [Acidobacteria bacterium]|nr:hypothetical protein [Acidobacteriota bacterium]
MEGVHTTLRISGHPYLFDAMFTGPWPRRWSGQGTVQIYDMAGGPHEVIALVEADDRGRLALERAGFRVQIATPGERLDINSGGPVRTQ